MTQELDPTNYSRMPQLNVASATALTTSLVSAMSSSMPGHVKRAAKDMVAAKDKLLFSWRNEPIPTVDDRRPADIAVDRAWAALHSRIKATSSLPVEDFAQAARAAELLQLIFPDGLTFLRLPFNNEWAESEKRLQMIDADGLAADIDAIASPEFLQQVRQAHKVYGRVLGITQPSASIQAPARAENLRTLRQAMSRYVFSVLSTVSDQDTANVARDALRPISKLREDLSARRPSAADDDQLVDVLDDVAKADETQVVDEAADVTDAEPKTDGDTDATKTAPAADDAPVMNAAMDADTADEAKATDCG